MSLRWAAIFLLCFACGCWGQLTTPLINVTSASISLKSSSIVQGGAMPVVDLSAYQTTGFFKLEFTELDGQCLNSSLSCNTQTVQSCCFSCVASGMVMQPDPMNTMNPLNCYCTQNVLSACIDLTGVYSQYGSSMDMGTGSMGSGMSGSMGSPSTAPSIVVADSGPFNVTRNLAQNTIHYFEFATLAPCNNLLLTVMTLSGDQNLYVDTTEYPVPPVDAGNAMNMMMDMGNMTQVQTSITGNFTAASIAPGYDWYRHAWSTRRLSDSIIFCAYNSIPSTMPYGMDTSTGKLNMVDVSGAMTRQFFIAVHGYLTGSYMLRFETNTPSAPAFLLSTVEYYHLAPALRHFHCGPNQYAVYGVPPTDDPGFSFFAIQSGQKPLDPMTMSNDTLRPTVYAFGLDISLTVNGATEVLFNEDIYTCHMNFSHEHVWYTKDGINVENNNQYYTLSQPSCDYVSFKAAHDGIIAMIQSLGTAMSVDEIAQLVMGGAMYSASDAWLGCTAFIQQNLMIAYPIPTTVTNTTRCFAAPGSMEFMMDPCCNASLLYDSCCMPRTMGISATHLIPLDNLISGQCSSPDCSLQASTEYAQVANSLQDSTVGCAAIASEVSGAPGFTDQQLASCIMSYTATCSNNADCPSDTTCNMAASVCVYPAANEQPIASCLANGLSVDLAIPMKMAVGLPPIATDAALAAVLLTNYTITGCNQPLLKLAGEMQRDWASDYNQSLCMMGGPFCNWDSNPTAARTQMSCEMTPWRGSMYCYNPNKCKALVPTSCQEESVFQGCFTPITSMSECIANGGIFDPNEIDSNYACWLNSTTTSAACLDSMLCDPSNTVCDPFCYAMSLMESDCNCTLHTGNDPFAMICMMDSSALTWDPMAGMGQCKISTTVYNFTLAGCMAIDGGMSTAWYRGGFWQDNYLTNATECQSAGVCSASWATTKTQCDNAVACSVTCDICNSTECMMMGECSDYMLDSMQGSCVVPPMADPNGAPTCPMLNGSLAMVALKLFPVGCIATQGQSTGMGMTMSAGTINMTDCITILGAQWMMRAMDNATCLSVMRCKELHGGSYVWTQKNVASCVACGGEYVSIFTWAMGMPTPAVWTPYVWAPRQKLSANTWGASLWNTTAVQMLLTNTYVTRYAQLAQTFLACKYGGVANYVSLLSCDCTTSGGTNCYASFQPVLLGVTRLCSRQTATFLAAPGEISSSPETVFLNGCANLQLSLIPAGRFRRSSSSIFSSLFLDSIQANEWAVLRNSKDVVIGQLIGNGVYMATDSTAQPGIELCLEIRSDIPRDAKYTVYTMALLSSNLRHFSVLSLANTTVRPNSQGVSSVCALVPGSGNYFAVAVTASYKNAKFSDTLSSQQRRAFYAGIVIYLVCWLLSAYRLASLILWSFLRPVDSTTGRVATKHPLVVPRVAMSLLFAFFFLRWFYFVLVVAGVTLRAPLIINILMAELPTYWFITIFTLLVLWWIEMYHRSASHKRFLGSMTWLFVGVNLVLYLFLLVVIIAYAVTENNGRVGVCSLASRSHHTADVISKVYKVFVSVIAFILAVGFMTYGLRFFFFILGKVHGAYARIIKFLLIAAICSFGLLLQCALLLYATFKPSDRKIDTPLAISLTLLADVLPGCVLVAFMRQPNLERMTWWQDIVWCWYRDLDMANSGTGSSYRNTQSGTSRSPASSSTIPLDATHSVNSRL